MNLQADTLWYWKGWIEAMQREGRLKEAIEELRVERLTHQRKIEELDQLIKALEARISGNNGSLSSTVVMHGQEFADADIVGAAIKMIERAGRPLHAKDIKEGLSAGGYKFRSEDPVRSVSSVLWTASRKPRAPIKKLKKNRYTTEKVGDVSKD